MMRRFVAGAVTAALVSALASSSAASQTRALQLPQAADIVIKGAQRVAAGGDVNGDGYNDLLLSEGGYDTKLTSPERNGRVYVVFLRPSITEVDLDDLGDDGFVIEGALPGDAASVPADAGDVNADGLADVIVGAPGSNSAYVVFGKADTLPVPLAAFDANAQGFRGFRIDGSGFTGRVVSGVGDMNQDGLDDVIVGAPFVPAAYVVFGKKDPLPVSLSMFHRGLQGDRGFIIHTSGPDYDTGYSVSGLGDTNGDAVPDVIVGRFRLDGPVRGCCKSWVVFGKSTADPVRVAHIRRGGYMLEGRSGGGWIGDVNADGLNDILSGGGPLFGKRGVGTVPYPLPPGRGFKFTNYIGASSLSGGGDVDGDGLPDFVVGVAGEDYCGDDCGSAYVVFGKKDSRTVRGASMGAAGFRIDGNPDDGFAGIDVAIIKDLNGDGRDEAVIAAAHAPCCGSGRFYIVFGRA